MLVAYYRRPDGSIRYFHSVDNAKRDTIHERAETYNNDPRTRDKVHIVEYAPDSFEAHLFEVATKAKLFSIETLNDLLSDLADAENQILDLIRQAEEAAE